jgi:ParB-like chromosome segregation protein Spo0J
MNLTTIEPMAVARLRPSACNARTHSKRQVRQIAGSIARFGFTNPILIDGDNHVIAGHGRLEAAKLLGLKHVPTLRLCGLDATQRRAYALADNKLALNSGWDRAALAIELQALVDVEFDAEVTGFSCAEIEVVLDSAAETRTAAVGKTRRRKESVSSDDAAVEEFGISALDTLVPHGKRGSALRPQDRPNSATANPSPSQTPQP